MLALKPTSVRDGSPPITRTAFPACRAPYPGGSQRVLVLALPVPRGLFPIAVMNARNPDITAPLPCSMPAEATLAIVNISRNIATLDRFSRRGGFRDQNIGRRSHNVGIRPRR